MEIARRRRKFVRIWDAKMHFCKGNSAFQILKSPKFSACGGHFPPKWLKKSDTPENRREKLRGGATAVRLSGFLFFITTFSKIWRQLTQKRFFLKITFRGSHCRDPPQHPCRNDFDWFRKIREKQCFYVFLLIWFRYVKSNNDDLQKYIEVKSSYLP